MDWGEGVSLLLGGLGEADYACSFCMSSLQSIAVAGSPFRQDALCNMCTVAVVAVVYPFLPPARVETGVLGGTRYSRFWCAGEKVVHFLRLPLTTFHHSSLHSSRPPCVPSQPLAAVQRLNLGQFQRPLVPRSAPPLRRPLQHPSPDPPFLVPQHVDVVTSAPSPSPPSAPLLNSRPIRPGISTQFPAALCLALLDYNPPRAPLDLPRPPSV